MNPGNVAKHQVSSGRRALVTGAASGIGRAVAARLAADGAQVTVLDLDGSAAAEVAGAIGGKAVTADLADPGTVAGLAADVVDVDILVNNAGLQHVAPIVDFDPDRFDLILRVMLTAPFQLARRALPGMYARGTGRIVNISSVHGHRASANKAAYVAAKHGLEGLSKVIALEGAGHGVTSNCVAPGYVRTPLVEGQIADQARATGIPEDRIVDEVLLASSALKRLVEPAEVADLVAWLCSPAARSVTGASYLMDGAWTAH